MTVLEPELGPSPAAVAALRSYSDLNALPDPHSGHLRAALGWRYGLAPEAFVVGPGATSLMHGMVARAAARGASLVHSRPSYALYAHLASTYRMRTLAIPLRDYEHDLPAIAAALSEPEQPARRPRGRGAPSGSTRPALVMLDSPHNVTGTASDVGAVLELASTAPAGTVIVYDNVYGEYQDDVNLDSRLRTAVTGGLPIVIARTFSKAHQLSGLRIGYLIGSPGVLAEHGPVVLRYDVASPAQHAAEASIRDRLNLQTNQRLTASAREQVCNLLTSAGLRAINSQSSCVLVDAGARAAHLGRALQEAGCQVRTEIDHGLPCHLQILISNQLTPQRVKHALMSGQGPT